MKNFLVFLLLTLPAFGQTRPYIEAGFDAGGSSYGSGFVGRAGVDSENARFFANVFANYDTSKKSEYGNGHVRQAGGDAFYKFGPWFAGGGVGWSETATQAFNKYSWHPEVGGGRNFEIWRLQIVYLKEYNEYTRYPTLQTFTSPGGQGTYQAYVCKCASGVQGLDINAWFPNPASNHHFFAHMDLEPVWFHATDVDPHNTQPWAVALRHQWSVDSFLSAGIVYRF